MRVIEREIVLDDLVHADEVVTVNSVRGASAIGCVSSIYYDNDITYGNNAFLYELANEAFTRGFSASE